MIDLHSHILFGLEDGSQSASQTKAMARQAWEGGVRKICATPHLPLCEKSKFVEKAKGRLAETQRLLSEEELGLELYLGYELSLDYSLLSEKELFRFTLNGNGKYLLCELPFGLSLNLAQKIFYQILLEGLIPIVAHVERSLSSVAELKVLEKLVEMGVLLQANAGSLVGQAGRKTKKLVENLLEADLVSVLASDAHDELARSYQTMSLAYLACSKTVGQKKALGLMEENPRLILEGRNLGESAVAAETKKALVS